MARQLRFLFIEPFFGGSHRHFAEGLHRHCTHRIDLETLPARFWKWRMRGAALYFIGKIRNIENYDGIISSAMLSVADLTAAPASLPPVLVYFHENQFTYPLSPGERPDLQYAFTNLSTALAADCVVFNSQFHKEDFFSGARALLRKMPEFRPWDILEDIQDKTTVLYPGVEIDPLPPAVSDEDARSPLIIWNHRWEHDKNPEDFFSALAAIQNRGLPFRLAVLGKQFRQAPAVFDTARDRFKNELVQFGYAESRETYFAWLQRGDIVISTARQENFGLSVVEAANCGCRPLLPNRLSYPEIVPREHHADVLYTSLPDLIEKLAALITAFPAVRKEKGIWKDAMRRFRWKRQAPGYDRILSRLASR